MIPETLSLFNSTKSLSINPSYPRIKPVTRMLLCIAVLTTALMQAFIPGESPPELNNPIFLIILLI